MTSTPIVLTVQVKELFFDREKVIRSVERGQRRAMTRVGGFVRTTARRSIRKRKRASEPGKPPSSHTGLLRGGIFFNYEPDQGTVVIGPVKFKNSNAPEVLEYGGTATIRRRNTKNEKKRVERVRVRARPYMGPALETSRERIPDAFEDIMR